MTVELAAESTEVAIFGRVIEAQNGDLPEAAARSWLGLHLSDADQRRLAELSGKAKRAELPLDEQALLENYLHVGRLIDLMQSKARLSLKAT